MTGPRQSTAGPEEPRPGAGRAFAGRPGEENTPTGSAQALQEAVRALDGPAGGRARTERESPGGRGARWQRALTLLLLALLGFGGAVAARVADPSARLAAAGPGELAAALDELGADGGRLAAEATGLEQTRATLAEQDPDGTLERDRQRAAALAVLAGTAPVSGPGITLTVDDPLGTLEARMLLDALQELRDAGAEAIELSGVRVVVSTYVIDRPGGGMTVDGVAVDPPYRLLAVGDAHTLAQAMRIPGGVLDTVTTRDGVLAEITESDRIEIRAVRAAPGPRHARPVE